MLYGAIVKSRRLFYGIFPTENGREAPIRYIIVKNYFATYQLIKINPSLGC